MNTGFKEWALICEALGRGEQSIIMRKGGIAEGRAGFRFQHKTFLLFPTLFHEQVSKLKVPLNTPLPAPRTAGRIEIKYDAIVEWTREISNLETANRLAPFHLWKDSVIADRFGYDDRPGIVLAFVRVRRLAQPVIFPDSPRYGGCRSWVELPNIEPEAGRVEVLDEKTHRELERQIQAVPGLSAAADTPCAATSSSLLSSN